MQEFGLAFDIPNSLQLSMIPITEQGSIGILSTYDWAKVTRLVYRIVYCYKAYFLYPGKSGKKFSIANGKILPYQLLKFIYSEKAAKFCKISTVDLSYVVPVKSTVEISENFVAFSEYMNFTRVKRNGLRVFQYLFII